jgi:large subunit ribosomal protein L5
MRKVRINKLVINIGTSSDEQLRANAKRLIEMLTGRKPVDEVARHRIPPFKITKGQKIGAYVTVRGNDAIGLAKRLLDAVDDTVKRSSITNNSVSFGVKEYIDISGAKYDPKIGMLGMNVNLSFSRSGLRVAQRKRAAAEVPKSHRVIPVDEIAEYMEKDLGVKVV